MTHDKKINMNKLILRKYLVVNEKGKTRVTSNIPSLSSDEIAIQLNLEIPKKLFKKPTLKADLKIDDSAVEDFVITDNMISEAENILKDQFKIKFGKYETIKPEPPKPPKSRILREGEVPEPPPNFN